MFSILHIFTLSYWFSKPLEATSFARVFWIIFPIACILFGIILKISKQKHSAVFDFRKRILYRLSNTFFCFGILLLLWFVLRQQQIVFWGYRFWLLIIIVLSSWHALVLVKKMKKRIPEIELRTIKQKKFYAYLPHRK